MSSRDPRTGAALENMVLHALDLGGYEHARNAGYLKRVLN